MFGNSFTTGNRSTSPANGMLAVGVGSYVAGNTFSGSEDRPGQFAVKLTSNSHFVGNEISCGAAENTCNQVQVAGPNTHVIGNRFRYQLTSVTGLSDAHVNLLNLSSNGETVVASNVFSYEGLDNALGQMATNRPVSAFDNGFGSGNYQIYNNVIHVDGNLPEAVAVDGAILISSAGANGRVSGNIIEGWAGPVFESIATLDTVEFVYNVCHNNQDEAQCDANGGNVVGDPLFANTSDFTLAAGSPAIDAGEDQLHLADIDGSRADAGVHGGPYGFSQFYDQRVAGTAPYIFPMFSEINLDNPEQLSVKAISVARFK